MEMANITGWIFGLTILGFVAFMAISLRRHSRKIMRTYEEIKIGDWFSFEIESYHPFGNKVIIKCQIIDKKLSKGNNPWIQYRYEDGSISQLPLEDFIEDFKMTKPQN